MGRFRGAPLGGVVVLAVAVVPAVADADQCARLSREQAEAAQRATSPMRFVAEACETCGENIEQARPRPLGRVSIGHSLSAPGWWSIYIDDRPVDLANVFLSADGDAFENFAILAGCPANGVTLRYSSRGAVVRETALRPASSAAPVSPRGTTTWSRPVGPVRFGLTGVLIAPGKSSGQPWDGPGALPPQVQQGLRTGLTVDLARSVLAAFGDGVPGTRALERLAPWAAAAINSAIAAPDVRVDVLLDSGRVSRARTRAHTLTPSWGYVGSASYVVTTTSQITIDAWDSDALFDDHIGVCTIQGMPLVDRNGYARGQDFTCNGQLWGVRLRVVAQSYEPVPDEQVPQAPPPSAISATTPTSTPTQSTAAEVLRRGGVGESCTRTDDCTAPLRCIRHECVEPPQ